MFVALACSLVLLTAGSSGKRLPYSGVRPAAYDIYLEPHFQDSCQFRGKVKILLDVENSTDEIVLHSRNLRIDDSTVSLHSLSADVEVEINKIEGGERETEYEVYNTQNISLIYGERDERHFLKISFPTSLEAGTQHVLSLSYNGTMNTGKTSGIYCRKYRHENETRWFASATFEPFLARSAFPCFDEPGYKANITLMIAHPEEYSAISNMPAAAVRSLDDRDGWTLTEFKTSPPMSTYLLGFLISRYMSRELSLPDRHILRAWTSSEEKLQMADLPLAFGRRHYLFLANYTGLSDPLPKTDFIAIRHYLAGGLENWGIISLEERLMLLDSKARSRKSNLLRTSSLIAHELAHTWFGNLVTPEYWDDIWLSEGFASYFASKATSQMYPNYGYEVQAWILSRMSAMSSDRLPTTHALKVPLKDHPTGDFFDDITYRKGELIVRMIALIFGEEPLQRALRNYLKERMFQTASESLLWEYLEQEIDPDLLPENVTLAEVMNTWTRIPGYPVVTAKRNYNTGEVTIHQRSVLEGEGEAGGWWIPLSYTCANEKNFTARHKLWLAPFTGPTTMNISASKDDWIIFNTGGAGYYTVRYDDRNSLLIADDLENLPLVERIQVFGDILDLGRLGQTPVELSLDVMMHFKVETSPFPWFIFLSAVPNYMSLFKSTPIESDFKTMVHRIVEPEMNKLTKDSPHSKQVIKLSCKLGVKNCTDMATQLFEEWKQNSTKLPEDIQYTVFCTAIAKGNKTTWEYMMERYKAAENHKEKKDILKALACTTDKELNKRYIDWALDKNKAKDGTRKSSTVLKAMAENDPSLVLEALRAKKSQPMHAKLCRGKHLKWKRVLETLALNVNTEEQLKQLKQIVEDEKSKLKSAESRMDRSRVIEIAEHNIAWLQENKSKAKEWFKRRVA